MLPPLLHLITSQPQLLADHAEAYADLLGMEAARACLRWKQRLVLGAGVVCGVAVAVVLAGVAVMLAAVLPPDESQARWVLAATPLLPLLVAAGCGWALNDHRESGVFDSVKSQIKADLLMLREASAP